ncbi:MAG: response regulator transcription factor [Magnetococcales bacterium]|nr:response regulator transcription factor [Magnetococcales bacterium]MBF0148958.1 response regulator transcription factor [Magnetococcales bacterium]MBF0173823.1 response regulator transcription factor [Magnetococcales bacterium]MBF0347848.1 response regulator transcription factor [Magnetococcales bacterium]MBF0631172.1 response regulator transcription factor [Magnetococcales bacterium]
MAAYVLLLEDDPSMRFLLGSYLEKSGFRVTTAANAADFFAACARHMPDCVLLDLGLPDEDGLVVARKIRQRSDVPMIIVTSRQEESDRLTGLELGADDYVVKPFHPRELIARIHNLLQRSSRRSATTDPVPSTPSSGVPFGELLIDFGKRQLVVIKDHQAIVLTPGEFDCLAALILAKGNFVTRDQLKDAISNREDPPDDRTVDSIICKIRRKIKQAGCRSDKIRTVRGHGYQIDSDAFGA